MACPTVEIIGKNIILLSGYQRYAHPQSGSVSVKLGSIEIPEMSKLRHREQKSRRRGVRLHGWKWIPAA